MAAPSLKLGLLGTIPYHKLYPTFYTTRKGDELTFHQTKMCNTIGSWVYDGAFCLAKYMESDHFRENHGNLQGKRVLEIGAGCGNVGIVASCYGANSILTDLEPLVALMQYNVEMNKEAITGEIASKPYAWGCEVDDLLPQPDFLILANCVYYRPSLEDLLESMLLLTNQDNTVVACYELRSPEIHVLIKEYWHGMVKEHFDIEEIPSNVYRCKFADEVEILIVTMKRKKSN